MNDETKTESEVSSYEFQSYDPKNTPSIPDGMRISKCQYKKDKDGNIAGENSFVLVPEIVEASIPDDYWPALMPHVIGMMEAAQDKVIKAIHKDGSQSVALNNLSLDTIIDKLDETGESRLNKEQVFQWFDSDVKELLIIAFADKLGISDEPTDAETSTLEKTVDIYRTRFGALAGGRSVFVPAECDKLLKALEVTETDSSPLGMRFSNKLEVMKVVDEMAEL